MTDPTDTTSRERLRAAADGDSDALGELFEPNRAQLRRMIELRIDPRVRQRVDVSDVIQEAFLDAARQLPDYVDDPRLPFHLWLRMVTGGRLMQVHRYHLDAKKRDVRLELRPGRADMPAATSVALAQQLTRTGTSPSGAAIRAEERERLEGALTQMKELDREVLALRHFERLTNGEVAQLLELSEQAASARYVRAVERLSELLEAPG